MRRFVPANALLIGALVAAPAVGQERQPADLVIHGGPILTMDSTAPVARAVAIRGGRIVAIGSDELLRRFQATEVIDLKGRAALPGFNDSHIHINGDPPWHIDLSNATSVAEIRGLVAAKAKELGPGAWITGYGWSEDQLEEGRRPLRSDLDSAAPENPVILDRAGGHSGVANSVALRLAGVDRKSPDPEGGVIERDAAGELNGIIRERQAIVSRLAPVATADQLRPSFVAKLKGLLALGITSIIEASTALDEYPEWERVYREHAGELPRAAVQIRWAGAERMRQSGRKTGDGNEWLRVGAVKLFVDGGFTGPAAYTLAPYKGQTEYRGKLNYEEEQLAEILAEAHGMGWQLGLHTIGDGAIVLAVDLLARTLAAEPRADHRHYLNHFSMKPPSATLAAMARIGIAVAQQPNFSYTLEGRYIANLSGDRLAYNNPLRSVREAGVFLALGSDILPIGPMIGLYAATTRRGQSGAVYAPDERLSLGEALAAYTRGGAYLTREEDFKGTLAPGRAADLAVLAADPRRVSSDALRRLAVDVTVLGGRVVFRREAPVRRGPSTPKN